MFNVSYDYAKYEVDRRLEGLARAQLNGSAYEPRVNKPRRHWPRLRWPGMQAPSPRKPASAH
jgi:hypothetical protein